jgi:hypothetical protein
VIRRHEAEGSLECGVYLVATVVVVRVQEETKTLELVLAAKHRSYQAQKV